MSDVADTPSKSSTKRDGRTDKQIFAQVDKWMAMIREINRERPTEPPQAA